MSLEIIRKKIPSPKFAAKIQQIFGMCKKNGDFCHFFLRFAICNYRRFTQGTFAKCARLVYGSFTGHLRVI